MSEHKWGQSESGNHEPVDIVDQLAQKIETLPADKVAEAEAQIKEAINNKNRPGEIFSSVLAVIKGLVLLLVVCFVCAGCTQWPGEVKDAQSVKAQAILNYAKNQALLHEAEQEAYRQEARAHVETKFQHDLLMLQRQADDKGLVSAEDALTWVQKVAAEKDTNLAEVEAKVTAIEEEVRLADEDLKTALKLDALIEKWSNKGLDSGIAQDAAMQILDIFKNDE